MLLTINTKQNFKPPIAFFATALILLTGILFYFDMSIVEWVASVRTEFVIDMFDNISELGDGTEYYVTILFLLTLGWLNSKSVDATFHFDGKPLRDFAWLSLKIMIVTGLCILILKTGIGRSRPDLWIDQGIIEFLPFDFNDFRDFKSFPSGHTQTAFTMAVLLSLLLPRFLHPILYILAILVGISRVVLLDHWPSDIVIGALLGILIPLYFLNARNHPD